MKRNLLTAILMATALGMSASAQAQMRSGRSVPVRVSAPIRIVRLAQLRTSVTRFSDGTASVRGPQFFSSDIIPDGSLPVPGLGFDFAHVAALNRNFSATSPSQNFTPIVPIVFPLFPAQVAPQIIVVQQPPVVIVQPQPAMAEEAPERPARSTPVESLESVAPARAPEPPREAAEYVLLRRDGRLLFAVAFSTDGRLLTYITREGVRRSVPLADLDLEATRRMNEERGITVHLPA